VDKPSSSHAHAHASFPVTPEVSKQYYENMSALPERESMEEINVDCNTQSKLFSLIRPGGSRTLHSSRTATIIRVDSSMREGLAKQIKLEENDIILALDTGRALKKCYHRLCKVIITRI
jgi:hypothetical protein